MSSSYSSREENTNTNTAVRTPVHKDGNYFLSISQANDVLSVDNLTVYNL